jgi:hypothetical protein
MSKTDKTKPSKVQIREATEKYGEDHINWHTDITFSRTGPEQFWRKQDRKRKDKAKYGKEDWND